ncbi:MAG TPA: hypothetical protein VMW52_02895 [Phycisphaerae bacterium]|nr:hypothetical protein [Phycisphaerae bacterium]
MKRPPAVGVVAWLAALSRGVVAPFVGGRRSPKNYVGPQLTLAQRRRGYALRKAAEHLMAMGDEHGWPYRTPGYYASDPLLGRLVDEELATGAPVHHAGQGAAERYAVIRQDMETISRQRLVDVPNSLLPAEAGQTPTEGQLGPPPAPPNMVSDPGAGMTRAMRRENARLMEQWQHEMAAWRRQVGM